ncbi:MAG: hypothetical protein LBV54_04585 [Puniceicoccales bacterium]|jgi:hypothetical protein|nr:hypothetical protein [Puniceicoccales bacterium]
MNKKFESGWKAEGFGRHTAFGAIPVRSRAYPQPSWSLAFPGRAFALCAMVS